MNDDGQSSSLPHVIVQRKPVPKAEHFESFVGAKPQSESSGAAAFLQSLELNSFFATQVLERNEQMSDLAPSMLVAFVSVAE